MHLFLLGLRCSGKSVVGAAVAHRAGVAFVDLDTRTAKRLGASSAGDAIGTRGWEAFRLAECEAMADAAAEREACVIALGGGTPTAPGASARLTRLRDEGLAMLVYLRVSPATLRERLTRAGTADRPAVLGGDPLDEIESLYEQRDGLYRALADVAVDAEGPVAGVAMAVLEAWERDGSSRA